MEEVRFPCGTKAGKPRGVRYWLTLFATARTVSIVSKSFYCLLAAEPNVTVIKKNVVYLDTIKFH